VGAAIDSSVMHRQYTVSLFSLIIRPPTNSTELTQIEK
jgi:hypothetical protein